MEAIRSFFNHVEAEVYFGVGKQKHSVIIRFLSLLAQAASEATRERSNKITNSI